MNTQNDNKFVAQGAAAWQEKERHEQIINDLNQVYGYDESCIVINGVSHAWTIKKLENKRALEIVNRGHHDEIMYMIERYRQANCPPEKRSFLNSVSRANLPDEVKKVIAERNNPEEVEALLSWDGYGYSGQDVIFARNDHFEKMRYLERHGFDAYHQRLLLQANDSDEIALQIKKHGLADELLDEMFEGLREKKPESLQHYYLYISYREFPEKYQKQMLRIVRTPEFEAYVDKHGLWEWVHEDLLEYRLMSEVRYYLERHPYLTYKGLLGLAKKSSHDDKMFYISTPNCDINGFLWAMFKFPPFDYEVMTQCFLRISASENEKQADIDLMKTGSHDEVMERIKQGKLSNRALTALFFRNSKEEFETYISLWEKSFL